MADATDVAVKLKLNTSEYLAQVSSVISQTEKKFASMTSKQEQAFNSVSQTATKVAKIATAAAVGGLAAFTKSALSTYSDYQSKMSQVAATLGYSVAELHDPTSQAAQDMEALRSVAQELGRTTEFTASQAAEGLNYMALAGYDAKTSIEQLPKVLNLASAGNMDLARASDMVTDAQTALGLNLDDTTVLIDQMARTASRSNTSVEQLGDAILTIGATAQFMTGGTKELNTVLGVLADNGIKGTEAGTHLRNALLRLASPTANGKKLLDQLGVSVYDAEGNMRKLSEIFPELSKAMEGMTSQEKIDAFGELFNIRDMATANALLGTTAERWEELGNEIENSMGAAAQMAETQRDNIQGSMTKLSSAWDNLKIKFSEKLEKDVGIKSAIDDLIAFIDEHGDQIMTFLAGVVEGIINITTGVANFLVSNPWILEAAAWLIGIITLFSGLTKAITVVTTVVTALTSPVGIVVAVLAGIGLVVTEIIKHWDDLCAFFGWTWEQLKSGVQFIATLFKGVFGEIGKFVGGIFEGIGKAAAWLGNFFKNVFQGAFNTIKNIFSGIGNFFSSVFGAVANLFRNVGTAIGNAVSGAFKAVVNGVLGFVEGFINIPINAINGLISVINIVPGVNISKLPRMSFPRLETGGIVPDTPGGRLILAGEGGQDEWVVPESKMASLVAQINDRLSEEGTSQNITINLSGTFATSAEERRRVADQIVEAIQQNNRRRFTC